MPDFVPDNRAVTTRSSKERDGFVLYQDYRWASVVRITGYVLAAGLTVVDSLTGNHLGWGSVIAGGLVALGGILVGEKIEKGFLIKTNKSK